MSKLNFKRLCLDTNVYIIGIQDIGSQEARILKAIGYYGEKDREINPEIILSPELIDQIRRVGKYLWGKDKAGFALGLVWMRLNIHYITPDEDWRKLSKKINQSREIPTEDIEIFLTAKFGLADCFVSANRKLLTAIAEFECLTPEMFVSKYLTKNVSE
ncbi:hypothetical protein [Gloeocapsa sp. PCC 73106]|uniref:hypothetical protein n=1 Tax=Gloeocapsa sp. PCC 73106 TaxID=102232 RepID=UPI0002AC0C14|nr:hypothetical protein [Gloeocapsa sp. PCC 73106]ELR97284.1 hypothetical protein GLO73106DRAFT_00010920 [Gloeocapsa sp. PCC 73106]